MTSTHYCFCELAPLYVLGTLSDEERSWVEQQIRECPELAEELAMAEEAVSALAYSLPPLAPAQDLKQRLFQRIADDDENQSLPHAESTAAGSRSPVFAGTESLNFDKPEALSVLLELVGDLKWRPYQAPGVMVAPLHINYRTRRVVCLLKAEAGIRYPLHNHAEAEEIFMLAGDLVDGDRTYRAGDYIRSESGSTHAPRTEAGCIFLVRASLDDKILETIAKPSPTSWLHQLWQK